MTPLFAVEFLHADTFDNAIFTYINLKKNIFAEAMYKIKLVIMCRAQIFMLYIMTSGLALQ